MDICKLKMIVPIGLVGITLALVPASGADEKKAAPKKPAAAAKKPATAAPKSTKPAASGMVVVKDPETGQLRAPTAEEAAALNPPAVQANSLRRASPQAVTAPDGSISMVLDDSAQVFAVARKNPDGTVSLGEVTGADKAKAAVMAPKTATKTSKEPANDR